MMQLMAQNQISSQNKELPQELQQLMDNQTRICANDVARKNQQ